jgi:hypothetical protein
MKTNTPRLGATLVPRRSRAPASGWTDVVATNVGSPGTPNRIDATSPIVFVTACREEGERLDRRHLEHERQGRARVVDPPTPGRIPTANPMATLIGLSPTMGYAMLGPARSVPT